MLLMFSLYITCNAMSIFLYCYRPGNFHSCPDNSKEIFSIGDIENTTHSSITLLLMPKTLGEMMKIDFNNSNNFNSIDIIGNEYSLLSFTSLVITDLRLYDLTFMISEQSKIHDLFLTNCTMFQGYNEYIRAENIRCDTRSIRDINMVSETTVVSGDYIPNINSKIFAFEINIKLLNANCSIVLDHNVEIVGDNSSILISGTLSMSDVVALENSNVIIQIRSRISSDHLKIELSDCSAQIFQTGYMSNILIILINSLINTRNGIDRKIALELNSSTILIDKYLKIDAITFIGDCNINAMSDAVIDSILFCGENLNLKSNFPTDILAYSLVSLFTIRGENISFANVYRLDSVGAIYVPLRVFIVELVMKFNNKAEVRVFDKLEVTQIDIQISSDYLDTFESYDLIVGKEFEILRANSFIGHMQIIESIASYDMNIFGDSSFFKFYLNGRSLCYKMISNPFYRNIKACYACTLHDDIHIINIKEKNLKNYIKKETLSVTIIFREENVAPFVFPDTSYDLIEYRFISDFKVLCDPTNINSVASLLDIQAPLIFTKPYNFNMDKMMILGNITFQEGTTLGNISDIIVRFEEVEKVLELNYTPTAVQLMNERSVYLYNDIVAIDNICSSLNQEFKIILTHFMASIINCRDMKKPLINGNLLISIVDTGSSISFVNFTAEDIPLDVEILDEISVFSNGYFPAFFKTKEKKPYQIFLNCDVVVPQIIHGSTIIIISSLINSFYQFDNLTLSDVVNFYSQGIRYNYLYINGAHTSFNDINALNIIVRSNNIIIRGSNLNRTKVVVEIEDNFVPHIYLIDCSLIESHEVNIKPTAMLTKGSHPIISTEFSDGFGFIPIICPYSVNDTKYRLEMNGDSSLILIVEDTATPAPTPKLLYKKEGVSELTITTLASIPISIIIIGAAFIIYRKAKTLVCQNNIQPFREINLDVDV